jgi:vitamin B12 transporter
VELKMFKLPILKSSIIFFIFFVIEVVAKEIPTIVISAGKTPQSLSTVGSTVEVITSEDIKSSTHNGIANIIDDYSTSTNLFQMGGAGGNIGIQLRGLEKRYSTVYIDGVKMLDPSSSDGSFYLENVMKSGIERVEVLKGTQSSLYGGNAIGGTINIFTKKGREGKHSNFEIGTASKATKNITYSIDGDDGTIDYFLSGSNFITDGPSTMNDNDEDDAYKNNSIIGNLGYKINEDFRLQNSFRLANSYFEYDEVDKSINDNDTSTTNLEGSLSLKLIHEKSKFKNTISYNKLHIERETTSNVSTGSNYFGYRDAFNYLGEYNFNLDNKIVYGIDSEFDAARYYKGLQGWGVADREHDESIISQYFDYQFRPFEKLYSTIGFRSDDHTTVGRKTSGRGTIAYQLDGNSKIRSSLGSGIRFPALYDFKFGGTTTVDKGGTLESLQAERGNSFDIGYDTYIDNLDLGLSMTFFKTEQKNSLKSDARTSWVVTNNTGVNTSEGIEFGARWKPTNEKYGLGFGYTFTDSYDANTCDPREKESYSDNECRHSGSAVDTAKVRVPRHAVHAKVDYSFYPNLKSSFRGKYISETRDFGNTNDSWTDQILTNYFVFDLASDYELYNGYNLNFSINNIFNEQYQQAHEYTAPGRTFALGLKKIY